jgi:hypothetical protein
MDKDGALSPAEVDNLFSTCPSPLWGPDVRCTVPTNSKVLYFIAIYMCEGINAHILVILIY